MEKLIDSAFVWRGPPKELRRSDYSLVSCGDLTAGSLDVWRALPDQVKYDPALAPFRELYEKEHDTQNGETHTYQNQTLPRRLPFVNSAPHLNGSEADRASANKVFDRSMSKNPEISSHEKEKDLNVGIAATDKTEAPYIIQHKHEGIGKLRKKAGHYIKMTSLLACWLFFTSVFLLCNERKTIVRYSSVAPDEVKSYYLNSSKSLAAVIKLSGPFWSEQSEKCRNLTDSELAPVNFMEVWLEKLMIRENYNETVDRNNILETETSERWRLLILDEHLIDFSEGETRSRLLSITSHNKYLKFSLQPYQSILRIRTDSNKTTPFTLTYTLDPLDPSSGVGYAAMLLCGLYGLIIFEVIHRTLAAVLISTCAVAVLAVVGERPSLPELVSWLDLETLLLLFSMMLLVAIMAETGMFDYLAVFTFSVTKGKVWPLMTLLWFFTATISTILDNVTTVLLMTPVTIRLCEVMQLNPVLILMAMVLYSNIGGTATPVGDPPNVIIVSNAEVIKSGIHFGNFTLHMTLGIILVSFQTYFQLRFMYRDTNKLRLSVPKDIQELRQQIMMWRRAAATLSVYSRDEMLVRLALEKKVAKLDAKLRDKLKERKTRAVSDEDYKTTLAELQEKYKIKDKTLLIKATVAVTFVVILFFLHIIPDLQRISLGWTALLGAILLLILADRKDMDGILNRVDWSTLLFFAALFICMEVMSKLGLIQWIGRLTESLILQVDEGARLAVSIVLIVWISGVASAFVDNIPLTTMMIRVVTSLGSNPTLGLPMAPLIWALSFGVCLGGNGTLIGASANVVTAGVAEQHGYRFTFVEFFRMGFPLMLGHLVTATAYLLVCHCAFTWH